MIKLLNVLKLILRAISERANWWLRSVNSATNAANVNNNGNANNNNTSNANGVRPRFRTAFRQNAAIDSPDVIAVMEGEIVRPKGKYAVE